MKKLMATAGGGIVAALIVACAATDCVSRQGDSIDGISDDALTAGYVPASVFNKSGLRHSLNGAGVKVIKTREDPILTYGASHMQIGSVGLSDGPNDGNIRIATLEEIGIDGVSLFRVWPGGSSHQGWIDLADVTTARKVHQETDARMGNGEPCGHRVGALTTSSGQSVRYVITPKAVQETGICATSWKFQSWHTSSPGPWFQFHPDWDQPAGSSRVFLMWSWTPSDVEGHNSGFAGGGVVRTEMAAGTDFFPCKVQPVRTVLREVDAMKGATPDSTARKLSVYAAYGMFPGPTHPFHGWTIVASRLDGGTCQMHVACTGGPAECPLVPLPDDCTFNPSLAIDPPVESDCEKFASHCVHDDLGARCVSNVCLAQGTADSCWFDGIHLATCNNGHASEGADCGVFAAHCVNDNHGARCVSTVCPAQGTVDSCWFDGIHLATCNNGHASEGADCAASGMHCVNGTCVL
jgi:hypothetical protein